MSFNRCLAEQTSFLMKSNYFLMELLLLSYLRNLCQKKGQTAFPFFFFFSSKLNSFRFYTEVCDSLGQFLYSLQCRGHRLGFYIWLLDCSSVFDCYRLLFLSTWLYIFVRIMWLCTVGILESVLFRWFMCLSFYQYHSVLITVL